MSYQAKELTCSDCGSTFTFSAEEQQQFADRGYMNEPKRCSECRQTRRARNPNAGSSAYSSYGSRSPAPRQMFNVKCAACGKDAQVPFEPRGDRPVYCSDCYRKNSSPRRY